MKIHGDKYTRLYRIWLGMRNRCRIPSATGYKNYGARGIRVCKRWESYILFKKDMGIPKNNLSLDRINNNKNYSKSNCRWVTRYYQSRNSRRNIKIKYKNRWFIATDFASQFNIPHVSVWRYIKQGMKAKEILQHRGLI